MQPVRAHHATCLGCGPDNPCSLGLQFFRDGERVHATFTLTERHEGAPGFAHGGALATALDDAVGSLLYVVKRYAVTAKLEVNYRRPALVGQTFDVEARVEAIDGRKLWFAAELRREGEVVADARALFLEVDPSHFAQGGGVPDVWRSDPPY